MKLNLPEIEELFAANASKAKSDSKSEGGDSPSEPSTPMGEKAAKKPELVSLLDAKTANNMAIAISRFKLTPEQIAQALEQASDDLSADQLSSLASILPSAEDAQIVKDYNGDTALLGKAETFVLAVSKVPRYAIRAKCMLTRATFDEKYAELKESVETVSSAVKEVRSSKALRRALEFTLALGNYLNGGTNKGAAWGFKLDTLSKIVGTKTIDGKSTLLHYLARNLDEAGAAEARAKGEKAKGCGGSLSETVEGRYAELKGEGEGEGTKSTEEGKEEGKEEGGKEEGKEGKEGKDNKEGSAGEPPIAASLMLLREMSHLEAAARLSWKDESAELNALNGAVKVVESQVKVDQVAEFKERMGTFHAAASKQVGDEEVQR